MHKTPTSLGFTMLELLLTVAALTVLVAAVLIVIEPERILEPFDNVNQEADIRTMNSALRQYYIDNRVYPEGVGDTIRAVCNTGSIDASTDPISEGIDCTDKIDLSVLVPQYLAAIPFLESDEVTDPTDTGYRIVRNSEDNRLSVTTENITEEVAVTPEVTRVNTHATTAGNNASVALPFTPSEGNLLVVMAAHRESAGGPVMSSNWNFAFYDCVFTGLGECSGSSNSSHRRGLGMWWQVVGSAPPASIQIDWTDSSVGTQYISIQEYSFSPEVSNVLLNNHYVANSSSTYVDTISMSDVVISEYSLVVAAVSSRDSLGVFDGWVSDLVNNSFSEVAFDTSVSIVHSYGIVDTPQTYATNPSWNNFRNANIGALVFTFQ